MDKYKKLISNTFIFAVGTFSSKLLVFLLMPLYTRVLTPEDYGVVNLIVDLIYGFIDPRVRSMYK